MKTYFVKLASYCLIGSCALVLAACGNKGSLTLPNASPSQPAQTSAKKPLPASSAERPGDHSSPATPKTP